MYRSAARLDGFRRLAPRAVATVGAVTGLIATAGVILDVALAGPAAAATAHGHHGGLSHKQIIEIVVACAVAIVLIWSFISLLRRNASKKLIRETAAMPFSPQAILGRLPPGRDVYGHDLYAAEVVGAGGGDAQAHGRMGASSSGSGSGAMSRPYSVPWAGKPTDANMLSYELERLAVLRDAGTISDKEYGEARRRLLG
jgi:hypothetical protein